MADSHDVQHSIIELQGKRSRLGLKKQQLQEEVTRLREMLKYVQQGNDTHAELVTKKNGYILELQQIDTEILDLKDQIKKRQLLKDEVSKTEEPKILAIEAELTVQRDYYLNFAGDKTRVASMRAMSAEFAGVLTRIIKKLKK